MRNLRNSVLIVRTLNLVLSQRYSWAVAAVLMVLTIAARAQTLSANAQLNGQAGGGGTFNFTITLNNSASSSAGIQTFWYAWTPGGDYLPSSPSLVTPPSGWSDTITHFGPGDGYGIEFTANTAGNALAPGQFLDFNFETLDTPAALAGNSPYYPTTPVGSSFVYAGTAFTTPSATFDVQSVPEPSALALLTLAGLVVFAAKRKPRTTTTDLCRAQSPLERV